MKKTIQKACPIRTCDPHLGVSFVFLPDGGASAAAVVFVAVAVDVVGSGGRSGLHQLHLHPLVGLLKTLQLGLHKKMQDGTHGWKTNLGNWLRNGPDSRIQSQAFFLAFLSPPPQKKSSSDLKTAKKMMKKCWKPMVMLLSLLH